MCVCEVFLPHAHPSSLLKYVSIGYTDCFFIFTSAERPREGYLVGLSCLGNMNSEFYSMFDQTLSRVQSSYYPNTTNRPNGPCVSQFLIYTSHQYSNFNSTSNTPVNCVSCFGGHCQVRTYVRAWVRAWYRAWGLALTWFYLVLWCYYTEFIRVFINPSVEKGCNSV